VPKRWFIKNKYWSMITPAAMASVPDLQVVTKILASDSSASDQFGCSVAIDGDTAVVGAQSWDVKTPSAIADTGVVYVYVRASGTASWTLQQQLQASDASTSDRFGYSVSISGNTIVIGAYGWDQDSISNKPFVASGAAYVFVRASGGTTWTQQQRLQPSDPQSDGSFGYSVMIDGDTIVAGAYYWNQSTPSVLTACGAAYVFVRASGGTVWTQQKQLLASDPSAQNSFGVAVAISGNTIVVGANAWDQKTPTAISDCGAAYVFVRASGGTTWTQQQQLLASDPTNSDYFGTSVSVNGDTVIVGAYAWDQKSPAQTTSGAAYVFVRASGGTTWTQQQLLQPSITSFSGWFGSSVSINGNLLVVGSKNDAYMNANAYGSVHVFSRTSSSTPFIQTQRLIASDPSTADAFGSSVSISGTTVMIGTGGWDQKTPSAVSDVGAVYYVDAVQSMALITGAVQDVSSYGASDGAIAATSAAGGVAPYSTQWSVSAGATQISTQTLDAKSALSSGLYTVTVTDSSVPTPQVRAYTYFISANLALATQILATDPTANDGFGNAIAVNVDTLVVGVISWDQKTPTALSNCGAAYVFVRASGSSSWTFQQRLTASDPSASDNFGFSVAISGNTIVVGSYFWDQKTPSAISNCGAAYVFVRASGGTTWTQQQQLKASDPSASDYFGNAVAVSSDTILVGAPGWDQKTPTAISSYGATYAFVRSGTVWTQQQQLLASDSSGGFTGASIAMVADMVVIGAPSWSQSSGAAYVFVRASAGSTWTEQQRLTASDPSASAGFGSSVAISGNTVAIGATGWDLNTPSVLQNVGAVYVFVQGSGSTTWTQQQRLVLPDAITSDAFGTSVALSGDVLVAGYAWDQQTPSAITDCGAAYVFLRAAGATTWTPSQRIIAFDRAASDSLGAAVAISGSDVFVSATGWDQKTPSAISNCGALYYGTVQLPPPVLLQRYSFNGTLVSEGSLALALVNPSSTWPSPTYVAGPVPGSSALVKSTASTYVRLPFSNNLNFANNTTFSLGGWFYYTSVATAYSSSNVELLNNMSATAQGLRLISNATTTFFVYNGVVTVTAADTRVLNTWIHYWFTFDSDKVSIYKNGMLLSQATIPDATVFHSTASNPWTIGRLDYESLSQWTGRIADVRWYSGVVSAVDVLYPPTLLQRYSFNGTLTGDGSLNLALQNPGTTLGTATYTTGPVAGTQAVSIPLNKYLELAPSADLQFTYLTPFSTGGWFNASAAGSAFGTFTSNTGTSPVTGIEWYAQISGTRSGLALWNNGTLPASGTEPVTAFTTFNQWVHSWLVYDGTIMKMYIGGVLVRTVTPGTLDFKSTQSWRICSTSRVAQSVGGLVAAVADVRWYSGVVLPATAMVPTYSLSATATSTDSAGNNGTITLTVVGGSGATYAWKKDGTTIAATTQNLTGLAPGVYVCTVTAGTESVTVTATIAYIPPAFGSSVAINGTNIVVGSRGWSAKQDPSILQCGAMYVYSRTGSAWNQVYKLSPNTTYTTTGGLLGNSVSLNSTHIVGGGQLLNTSTAYKGGVAFKQVWFNVAGVVTNSSYYGLNNGSITSPINAFGTAPYTFKWSDNPGFTTSYRSNLAPGVYTLTIYDADTPASTKYYTYTVTEPAQLTATFSIVNCSEYDVSDGSITTTNITGGTAPLTILWSTGAATSNLTGIGAGDYYLTIKDSLNYTHTLTVTVTEPSLSAASTGTTPISADIAWQTSRAPPLAISLYEIDYIRPDGYTIEGAVLTAGSSATVVGLTPSTTYTFKVYRVTNRAKKVRKPLATVTATTAPDVILNYTKASYGKTQIGTRAVYDLEKVDLVQAPIDFNAVFQTNDLVKVKTTIKQSEPAVVVKRGTTYTTPVLRSVLLPFTAEDGEDQEITIIETTTSLTKNITYNPTEEAVVVDGVEHTAGSRFNTGKYKVSVCIAK
jgi:FG-GAP repeat/Concanavalin A-like lectin/glucanases superfamily